ncbi:hypothetical protein P2318_10770 [Myxococcaceae bacterium GXIMD 01537]
MMKGFSQLAARCAGLLALVATSAWAQQEELWLDSRSAVPALGQAVLKKGRPYLVTMQGTYTVWGSNIAPGPQTGQPEPAPMFPSPNVPARNVGLDPEFVFAGVKASASAPVRHSTIEISLDGGKTWKHPATTAAFNATEHKYAYALTGEDSALQARIIDRPVTDNAGRLQLVVVPAEELWLDSRSAAPVPSQAVLKKGKPYLVTMQGTYTVWGNNIAPGAQSGQPKPAPMFPSPNVPARNVGFDPEFAFAGVRAPASAPVRNPTIQISLDGGKTWKRPATTAAFNATEHKYTYEVTGEDSVLQVRINDKPVSDNAGRLQIFVLPGA